MISTRKWWFSLVTGDVGTREVYLSAVRQQPRSGADAMEKLRIVATTWSIADGSSEG